MIRLERLSHFAGSYVVVGHCDACDRHDALDLARLVRCHGDITIPELRRRLRCRVCGGSGEIRIVWTIGPAPITTHSAPMMR